MTRGLLIAAKNSSVPNCMNRERSESKRSISCRIMPCLIKCGFPISAVPLKALSVSLSLSLSLSTLMAIYSNHPSVRPFESTTGPPFRHSSGDFTTPMLQCELSSLMSDLAGENHTGTTCMQIYHLIHMFLGIYMEIYKYIYTYKWVSFSHLQNNGCICIFIYIQNTFMQFCCAFPNASKFHIVPVTGVKLKKHLVLSQLQSFGLQVLFLGRGGMGRKNKPVPSYGCNV